MGFIIKIKLSSATFERIAPAVSRSYEIVEKLAEASLEEMVDRVEIIDELEEDAYNV